MGLKNGEMGQKEILLIIYVESQNKFKNIIENFFKKSEVKISIDIKNIFFNEKSG